MHRQAGTDPLSRSGGVGVGLAGGQAFGGARIGEESAHRGRGVGLLDGA
jgi:hypothetical protein